MRNWKIGPQDFELLKNITSTFTRYAWQASSWIQLLKIAHRAKIVKNPSPASRLVCYKKTPCLN